MKIRLILLSVLFMLFVTFIGFGKPPVAHAACVTATFSAGSSFTSIIGVGGNLQFSVPLGMTVNVGPPVNSSVIGFNPGFTIFNFGPGLMGVTFNLTGSGSATFTDCGASLPSSSGQATGLVTITEFTDGRLNNHDAFETSAIYCLGDGSVRVYVIGDPLWTIAFDASPAEIAKVPKHPAQNTLIKSAHGAALYRLTSGLLQVNSPGLNPADGVYHFAFEDCPLPK